MKSITLLSGSIFAGNPIVFRVDPSHIGASNIAFHRIIINVIVSLIVDERESTPVTIPMSVSLNNEEPQDIDISSTLRSVLDAYDYTPNPTTYPVVKWRIEGYDEYMLDGVLQPPLGEHFFPALNPNDASSPYTYAYCIAGSIPESQRIFLPLTPALQSLSDIPDSPALFPRGAKYVYTPALSDPVLLTQSSPLIAPKSAIYTLNTPGKRTVGGHSIYVLDDNTPRTTFRFINRYGVLECISVPRSHETSVAFDVKEYASGQLETFNSIRHGIVRKSNDRETLSFTTDPLTEDWLFWYIHEFFMAEHVWLELAPDRFVRCHIMLEDSLSAIKRNTSESLALTFKVKLDINGHLQI